MPASIDQSPDNKEKWKSAKKAARKQKGKLSGEDWALVMHIFKKMGGRLNKSENNPFIPKYKKRWIVYAVNPTTDIWEVIQYHEDAEKAKKQKMGLDVLYGKYIQVGMVENTSQNRLMIATKMGGEKMRQYKQAIDPGSTGIKGD